MTFENGAYAIPMDQLAANVIAAICEPDVNDSNGYDGSLVQYGAVTADADNNYPIYRYSYDNPRETLVSITHAVALEVGPASMGEVNTISVQVDVKAVEDVGAVVLGLEYDDSLVLKDVQGVDWQPGDINLVLNKDIDAGDSAAITLCFSAVPGAAFDPTVKVTVLAAAAQDSIEDYAAGASATGKAYLVGDANSDGKVAASDLVRLRNYIGMNGEGITVGAGADINSDGVVNGLDLTALHRYFATSAF